MAERAAGWWQRVRLASLLAVMASFAAPAWSSAHPLGNFTVNRAIVVEVGAGVEIRYIIDMAEIPAFEAQQQIDTDDDGSPGPGEVETYATSLCADALAQLSVSLDDEPLNLAEASAPMLTLSPGVGGLDTLRLECGFELPDPITATADHRLELSDRTDTGRIGWREVTARARGDAVILGSDVPQVSPTAELTAYPQDPQTELSDVRAASLTFRTGTDAEASRAPSGARVDRSNPADPLAALIGGELSPAVITLALLLALGLGALHALSPGHGKTLVAAYVLGAGGDARSAAQIGISVAVSHTAGVFALGVLTLLASELFLPERVIAWLSLVSGVVVVGLGLVLLARQWPWLARSVARDQPHGHVHTGAEPHHHGDHGNGDHGHGDHGHEHSAPTGALTWRSALALGFAGGAVPSASAVIVLLVAISSDRLAFGTLLIVMFGAGMAVVLGGLGLIIARVGGVARRAERGWLATPWARRLGRWVPVAAAVVVLFTGIVFAVTAAGQLG